MTSTEKTIAHIHLNEDHVLRYSPEIHLERHRVLSDMMQANHFIPHDLKDAAPYDLKLSLKGATLHLDLVSINDSSKSTNIRIGMRSLQRLIKDYFMICDSFYKSAQRHSPDKHEATDMARRGIHNEGAEMLTRILEKHAACDFQTARQLFTLICILHIRVTDV